MLHRGVGTGSTILTAPRMAPYASTPRWLTRCSCTYSDYFRGARGQPHRTRCAHRESETAPRCLRIGCLTNRGWGQGGGGQHRAALDASLPRDGLRGLASERFFRRLRTPPAGPSRAGIAPSPPTALQRRAASASLVQLPSNHGPARFSR